MKLRTKKRLRKILKVVLLVGVVSALVMGVNSLINRSEQKQIHPQFSLGAIAEDGTYVETKESIYTKDGFECKGLNIKLDFNSNVQYQVFLYDELDNFVRSTEVFTKSSKIETDETVKYARVVVTPIREVSEDVLEDEEIDNSISLFQIRKYSKQLTILVDKQQKYVPTEEDYIGVKLTDSMFTLYEDMNYYPASNTFKSMSGALTYEFASVDETFVYVSNYLTETGGLARVVLYHYDIETETAVKYEINVGVNTLPTLENPIKLTKGDRVIITLLNYTETSINNFDVHFSNLK